MKNFVIEHSAAQAQVASFAKTAHAAIDKAVGHQFAEGQILKWKTGKYAGRECIVKGTHWELSRYEPTGLKVWIWVYTTRLDGKGAVYSNDSFHRQGHNVNEFEVI